METTLRQQVLDRLIQLQNGSNPFLPQGLSETTSFQTTSERAAGHRRYGRLYAQVLSADDDDPIITTIADEVLPRRD